MSSTLTIASTRMVPWRNSVGPSTATAPSAATWSGLPCAKIVQVGGDHDGEHERGDQAGRGSATRCSGTAEPARHEGLDQHADAAPRRRRSASATAGRTRCCGALRSSAPVPADGRRSRRRSLHGHGGSAAAPGAAGVGSTWRAPGPASGDRRVDDVEQRLRVDAEATISAISGAMAHSSRGLEVVACPATSALTGAVHRALVQPQHVERGQDDAHGGQRRRPPCTG